MGYALFAQRKVVLNSQLNTIQLQQTQRSNEQYILATDELSLNQQLSSMQARQAGELANEFKKLSNASEDQVAGIQAAIETLKQKNQQELDDVNNELYLVSVKENSIEMEVKRLDTKISALQKQLEAVEEAEGSAIDRATPKFKGVG